VADHRTVVGHAAFFDHEASGLFFDRPGRRASDGRWFTSTDVRFGSKADVARCQADFRFTPESGHWNSPAKCPICAKSGLMQRSK